MKTILSIYVFFITWVIVAQTDVQPLGELPEQVWETSGLIYYNSRLITHNDSGNAAQLFEIDTLSLAITRTVSITNAENVDWEDITQDENYFYIGDFGNILGTRRDLKIYRIDKTMYDDFDAVAAEEIEFAYEDQTDFSDLGNSDWDAEAIFALDDQLVILTKQWKSNNTVAYILPKTPGSHSAQRLDEYDINGLVTGATYNSESQVLYIIGYNSLLGAFVNRVANPTTTVIFGGAKERLDTNIGFAQIEGITHTGVNSYQISSERFSNAERGIEIPSLLFTFKTTDALSGAPESESEQEPEPESTPETINERPFVLFRQIGSDQLNYSINLEKPILGWAIFDTSGKRTLFSANTIAEIQPIDISTLRPAIYYFSLYLAGETLSTPFAVD